MRLASSLITSLVWLMLPFSAACGADAITNEWELDIRSSSDSAPAVGADGTIYFGTWNGNLWAVNPDGSRKSWPEWLSQGKQSPAGRHTFATCRVWKKDSPLRDSGLLGPVKLYTTQQVTPTR